MTGGGHDYQSGPFGCLRRITTAGIAYSDGRLVTQTMSDDTDTREAAETCAVCYRRSATAVCERCERRMSTWLHALPGLYARLTMALVPGPGGSGERVSSSRQAPIPVRLAALSLLAGGSDDARALFVPAVRVWTTVVDVPAGSGDSGGCPARSVRVWHREPLLDDRGRPVMALTDDQTGALPVREWLRAWAMQWRHALGPEAVPDEEDWHLVRRLAENMGRSPLGRIAEVDPVAREWARRWPSPPRSIRDHLYLCGWLRRACERYPDIGSFAASLRGLIGALRAALGDVEDLEYLGRCPEELTDRTTREVTICGAAIWHDPYASVITCPRCHTETSDDRRVWLARRILDVWPIDARRRYPRGLIAVLRMPACATCSAPVTVDWIDASERADRERFWRPGAVTCPNGCATTD